MPREEEVDPPLTECPRVRGYVMVNTSTGEMAPLRCKAHWCLFCGPRNAYLIGLAINLSAPDRFIRLSLVPEDWQETRRVLNNLRRRCARRWGCEWAYHVEINPRGTGRHVHAFQHGGFMPQAELQEQCLEVGLGIPHIKSWKSYGESAVYGMKSITYGMKALGTDDARRDFLAANGRRLVHASRGFWRDGPGGERLTMHDAIRVSLARKHGNVDDQWVRMSRGA